MNNNNMNLSLSATIGDMDGLKAAVKAGADINYNNGEAIREAVSGKDLRMVEEILAHGGNVNQPMADGQWGGPLYLAAVNSDIPMMNYLLDHGADRYELAIGVAIRCGKTNSLKTLKTHGVPLQAQAEDIQKALTVRYSETVRYLVENGTDDTQFTALLYLDTYGLHQVISTLIYETDYLPSQDLYERLENSNLGYFLDGIANRELNKRLSQKFEPRYKEKTCKI